jgi:hypothetical protein
LDRNGGITLAVASYRHTVQTVDGYTLTFDTDAEGYLYDITGTSTNNRTYDAIEVATAFHDSLDTQFRYEVKRADNGTGYYVTKPYTIHIGPGTVLYDERTGEQTVLTSTDVISSYDPEMITHHVTQSNLGNVGYDYGVESDVEFVVVKVTRGTTRINGIIYVNPSPIKTRFIQNSADTTQVDPKINIKEIRIASDDMRGYAYLQAMVERDEASTLNELDWASSELPAQLRKVVSNEWFRLYGALTVPDQARIMDDVVSGLLRQRSRYLLRARMRALIASVRNYAHTPPAANRASLWARAQMREGFASYLTDRLHMMSTDNLDKRLSKSFIVSPWKFVAYAFQDGVSTEIKKGFVVREDTRLHTLLDRVKLNLKVGFNVFFIGGWYSLFDKIALTVSIVPVYPFVVGAGLIATIGAVVFFSFPIVFPLIMAGALTLGALGFMGLSTSSMYHETMHLLSQRTWSDELRKYEAFDEAMTEYFAGKAAASSSNIFSQIAVRTMGALGFDQKGAVYLASFVASLEPEDKLAFEQAMGELYFNNSSEALVRFFVDRYGPLEGHQALDILLNMTDKSHLDELLRITAASNLKTNAIKQQIGEMVSLEDVTTQFNAHTDLKQEALVTFLMNHYTEAYQASHPENGPNALPQIFAPLLRTRIAQMLEIREIYARSSDPSWKKFGYVLGQLGTWFYDTFKGTVLTYALGKQLWQIGENMQKWSDQHITSFLTHYAGFLGGLPNRIIDGTFYFWQLSDFGGALSDIVLVDLGFNLVFAFIKLFTGKSLSLLRGITKGISIGTVFFFGALFEWAKYTKLFHDNNTVGNLIDVGLRPFIHALQTQTLPTLAIVFKDIPDWSQYVAAAITYLAVPTVYAAAVARGWSIGNTVRSAVSTMRKGGRRAITAIIVAALAVTGVVSGVRSVVRAPVSLWTHEQAAQQWVDSETTGCDGTGSLFVEQVYAAGGGVCSLIGRVLKATGVDGRMPVRAVMDMGISATQQESEQSSDQSVQEEISNPRAFVRHLSPLDIIKMPFAPVRLRRAAAGGMLPSTVDGITAMGAKTGNAFLTTNIAIDLYKELTGDEVAPSQVNELFELITQSDDPLRYLQDVRVILSHNPDLNDLLAALPGLEEPLVFLDTVAHHFDVMYRWDVPEDEYVIYTRTVIAQDDPVGFVRELNTAIRLLGTVSSNDEEFMKDRVREVFNTQADALPKLQRWNGSAEQLSSFATHLSKKNGDIPTILEQVFRRINDDIDIGSFVATLEQLYTSYPDLSDQITQYMFGHTGSQIDAYVKALFPVADAMRAIGNKALFNYTFDTIRFSSAPTTVISHISAEHEIVSRIDRELAALGYTESQRQILVVIVLSSETPETVMRFAADQTGPMQQLLGAADSLFRYNTQRVSEILLTIMRSNDPIGGMQRVVAITGQLREQKMPDITVLQVLGAATEVPDINVTLERIKELLPDLISFMKTARTLNTYLLSEPGLPHIIRRLTQVTDAQSMIATMRTMMEQQGKQKLGNFAVEFDMTMTVIMLSDNPKASLDQFVKNHVDKSFFSNSGIVSFGTTFSNIHPGNASYVRQQAFANYVVRKLFIPWVSPTEIERVARGFNQIQFGLSRNPSNAYLYGVFRVYPDILFYTTSSLYLDQITADAALRNEFLGLSAETALISSETSARLTKRLQQIKATVDDHLAVIGKKLANNEPLLPEDYEYFGSYLQFLAQRMSKGEFHGLIVDIAHRLHIDTQAGGKPKPDATLLYEVDTHIRTNFITFTHPQTLSFGIQTPVLSLSYERYLEIQGGVKQLSAAKAATDKIDGVAGQIAAIEKRFESDDPASWDTSGVPEFITRNGNKDEMMGFLVSKQVKSLVSEDISLAVLRLGFASLSGSDRNALVKLTNKKYDDLSEQDVDTLNRLLTQVSEATGTIMNERGMQRVKNSLLQFPQAKGIERFLQSYAEAKGKGVVKTASHTVDLVLAPSSSILDAFQGRISGTCFGNFPSDMVRPNIVNMWIRMDGDIAGALLFTKQGDKLILIGFDTSADVPALLNTPEKIHEFVDQIMLRAYAISQSNGWELRITPQAGGISNTSDYAKYLEFSYMNRLRGEAIEKETYQPQYHYTIKTAYPVQASHLSDMEAYYASIQPAGVPVQTSAPIEDESEQPQNVWEQISFYIRQLFGSSMSSDALSQ